MGKGFLMDSKNGLSYFAWSFWRKINFTNVNRSFDKSFEMLEEKIEYEFSQIWVSNG